MKKGRCFGGNYVMRLIPVRHSDLKGYSRLAANFPNRGDAGLRTFGSADCD